MIIQQLFTENDCYKAGKYITPVGIMVHSTGANNPFLRRYLKGDELIGYNTNNNHWDMSGLDVCVHAFIGKDLKGNIQTYQTLPWDMRAWHSGGAANDTHISFEICEDNLKSADYFWSVYIASVSLCAYLCRAYGISPENVICHSEGFQRGEASNHADVMHWFPKFGVNMDDFRAAVKAALESEGTIMQPSEWAKAACDWAVEKGFIRGDENGDMTWQDNVTKEQLAVILKRFYEEIGGK